MTAHLLEHHIDYIERPSGRATAFGRLLVYVFLPDVNREELGAKSTRLHSPKISVSFDLGVGVIPAHRQVESVVDQRRRDVIVSIDYD